MSELNQTDTNNMKPQIKVKYLKKLKVWHWTFHTCGQKFDGYASTEKDAESDAKIVLETTIKHYGNT